MSWLPITGELTLERRSLGAVDAHGNPVASWSSEPWPIFGWAPGSSTEPGVLGVNRLAVDRVVFAPTVPESDDRVRFADGDLFEVAGEPEDWNHGPFGFEPGYAVNLRRVEG